jgi:hypothetical protein
MCAVATSFVNDRLLILYVWLFNIGFNDLAQLLYKDSSREFTQEKWYKKVLEGTISVSDVAYTL